MSQNHPEPEPEPEPDAAALHSAHEILEDPEFKAFALKKTIISLTLTVVTMGVYFGFIGLLAFAPHTLASPVGAASLGIPFGIGVIVLCWLTTGIYVSWANTSYDSQVARLKAKIK